MHSNVATCRVVMVNESDCRSQKRRRRLSTYSDQFYLGWEYSIFSMIVIFTPGGAMVYHTNSLQVLFDRQRPVSISGWGAIESDGRLQFICSPLEKLGPLEHCQNTKNTKPKKPTKKNQSEKNFWKNQPITKKSLPTTKKEIRWIFLPWSTKPWTSVPSFTKLKTLHLIPVLIILEIIPNVPIEHPQLNHGKMHQVKFHF